MKNVTYPKRNKKLIKSIVFINILQLTHIICMDILGFVYVNKWEKKL